MSALYTTSSFAHDDIAIVYYSIVLTTITILVAILIGVIQILSLIQHALEPAGHFWDGVEKVSERYDILGASIAGLFVVTGIVAYLMYTPIREIIDQKRLLIQGAVSVPPGKGAIASPVGTPGGASTTTTRVYPIQGETGVGENSGERAEEIC